MKRTIRKQPSLRPITLLCGLFAFLLFGAYVFQVNSLTLLAYTAQNSETELKGMSQETIALETIHQKTFAPQKLNALSESLNFVKAGTIHYVHILEGAVARQP